MGSHMKKGFFCSLFLDIFVKFLDPKMKTKLKKFSDNAKLSRNTGRQEEKAGI